MSYDDTAETKSFEKIDFIYYFIYSTELRLGFYFVITLMLVFENFLILTLVWKVSTTFKDRKKAFARRKELEASKSLSPVAEPQPLLLLQELLHEGKFYINSTEFFMFSFFL